MSEYQLHEEYDRANSPYKERLAFHVGNSLSREKQWPRRAPAKAKEKVSKLSWIDCEVFVLYSLSFSVFFVSVYLFLKVIES